MAFLGTRQRYTSEKYRASVVLPKDTGPKVLLTSEGTLRETEAFCDSYAELLEGPAIYTNHFSIAEDNVGADILIVVGTIGTQTVLVFVTRLT